MFVVILPFLFLVQLVMLMMMFIFYPHESHMGLLNQLCLSICLASPLAILHGKNFNIGHYMQILQPNFFIPAMVVGIVDFLHFRSLSVILALARGHKVSTKQNFIFLHAFQVISMNLMQCWCIFNWISWFYFSVRFIESRKISAVSLTASKHFNTGLQWDVKWIGAMRGVMVSMSAFLACHQCYCAGSSLAWGLNLRALVRGIFWSSSPGVFSGYSGFLPSFIGLMVQPIK